MNALTSTFLQAGERLNNRYDIQAEIGRGGYSVVYRAFDQKLQVEVAVKLLVPPPVAADSARERIKREAFAVRQLRHPNIITIYDLHEEGPWTFIIMELIDGLDLQQHVARYGRMGAEDIRRIGQELCSALNTAHVSGILHRDVKPQNLLLDPTGRAVLTDFGSAKVEGQETHTATGAWVGTLDYLAPEVVQGARPDGRADLYSLGVSLYVAATGGLPPGGSVHLPPPPQASGFRIRSVVPDFPESLDTAIARATAETPMHRYHTAAELMHALEADEVVWRDAGRGDPLQQFCLICGSLDHLGISVCPRCRISDQTKADTLIFARSGLDATIRARIVETVAALTDGNSDATVLQDAANGEIPLLAVSRPSAEPLLDQLQQHGIPARAVPKRQRLWAMSSQMKLILGLNLGLAWGLAWRFPNRLSALYWIAPVLVGASLGVAVWRLGRPAIVPKMKRTGLPVRIEAQAMTTIANMTSGPARDLLVDIVRAAKRLLDHVDRNHQRSSLGDMIGEVVSVSCSVARHLEDIDASLERLTHYSRSGANLPANWAESLSRTETVRGRLMQKMLELLSVLCQLELDDGSSVNRATDMLSQLTLSLKEEATIQQEAAEEVRLFLEGTSLDPQFNVIRV